MSPKPVSPSNIPIVNTDPVAYHTLFTGIIFSNEVVEIKREILSVETDYRFSEIVVTITNKGKMGSFAKYIDEFNSAVEIKDAKSAFAAVMQQAQQVKAVSVNMPPNETIFLRYKMLTNQITTAQCRSAFYYLIDNTKNTITF